MLLYIYYNSVVANLSLEKKGNALRFGGKIVFLPWHNCLFKIVWGWIGNFIYFVQ
jgi:hypothetical protein